MRSVSRTAKGLIISTNMRLPVAVILGALIVFPVGLTAQRSGPPRGVEDTYILRSLRVSRITPTDYCSQHRTGFPAATIEDRYAFHAVATNLATGAVTDPSGPTVGNLHACFGPTADSLVVSFYTEGDVHGMPLVGRGQCRITRREFPEAGITLLTCHLDLTSLPAGYVGGQLTSNTIASRMVLGGDTDPPGYTQASIATVRLWRKR